MGVLEGRSQLGAEHLGAGLEGWSLVGVGAEGRSLLEADQLGAEQLGAGLEGRSLMGAEHLGAGLEGWSLVRTRRPQDPLGAPPHSPAPGKGAVQEAAVTKQAGPQLYAHDAEDEEDEEAEQENIPQHGQRVQQQRDQDPHACRAGEEVSSAEPSQGLL